MFAWVIAIFIILGGALSIANLGVESYPNIAPSQIVINATYPGADAHTTEEVVTQVIEQQLTGIDNLDYFSATSSATGDASITLTFKPGTDPDIAQVQVQNKIALVIPRLPSEVVQQGVVVGKVNPGFLAVIALRSTNPQIDKTALADLNSSRIIDQIARLPGVGGTRLFGGEYAMNIWLNPDKLRAFGLSPNQVLAAVRSQNAQFAVGRIGAEPSPGNQVFTAAVNAEGRFSTAEEFRNIILRADSDGTTVRLSDVSRVEKGSSRYGFNLEWSGIPASGFAIQLTPGANALNVVKEVRATMDKLQESFPEGVTWFTPYDSSQFVKVSIKEVIQTLFEAMVLVFSGDAFVFAELACHDYSDTGYPGCIAGYIPWNVCGRFYNQSVDAIWDGACYRHCR